MPRLAVREFALAALALLAGGRRACGHGADPANTGTTPQPEGSYLALAGSSGPAAFGRNTACGGVISARHRGGRASDAALRRAHLHHLRRRQGADPVVDRGPYVPGRQFDLTDALARRLGLRGVQAIHWSYARSR